MINHSGNPFMVGCAYGKLQADGRLQIYTTTKSSLKVGSLIVVEHTDGVRTTEMIQEIHPSKIVTIGRNERIKPDSEDPGPVYYKPYKISYE